MYSRKERGVTQNLYLVDTVETNDRYSKEYVIMGSTGNIYNVGICHNPTCTCPDFKTRRRRCKHIYFVLIRIMKALNNEQTSYTNNELLEMFKNIPSITKSLVVSSNIKNAYDKKTGKDENQELEQKTDDLCPICLDDCNNGEELDHCKYSCGRAIHKVCFAMWTKKHETKCIFCSKSWTKEDSEYVNLLK